MPALRTVHASAPIRICDLGGWTDTWMARYGAVLNVAVTPAVEVSVRLFRRGSRDAPVVLDLVNYGVRYAVDVDAHGWGPHPFIEAALRTIRPPADVDVEVMVQSASPGGAATGTSAAVLVSLLGALDRAAGGGRSAAELARTAHAVETERLGRQSGVQDQLCAAHGGINFIEITAYPQATVQPLTLSRPTLEALNRRLLLIYLGRPHESSAVHDRVVADLQRLGPDCQQLDDLRRAAILGRAALLRDDLDAFGEAMRRNTEAQARLHASLVHRDARRVIEIAAAHGATGWKVNGAGGDGGSLTILTGDEGDAKATLVRAIGESQPQAEWIPIRISMEGLRVW